MAGGLALGAAAGPWAGCSLSNQRRADQSMGMIQGVEPGLQLFTLRAELERNFAETLDTVAEIGFREVQVSPRLDHAPAEIRRMLDASGLVCPSIHVELGSPTAVEVDAAQSIGAKTAFLSAPLRAIEMKDGKPVGLRTDLDLDSWKQIADELNETGRIFREAGIQYGYHNHFFEFAPVEGVVPFELLLERTDPDLVAFEIDFGWAQISGYDPVPSLSAWPGRFPVCHVKDCNAEGAFVDPGTGTVDFPRVLAAGRRAGLEHFFIEHDTTTAPLETARVGFEYLRSIELAQ